MTRYLFGLMCVLALGVIGCSETAGTRIARGSRRVSVSSQSPLSKMRAKSGFPYVKAGARHSGIPGAVRLCIVVNW